MPNGTEILKYVNLIRGSARTAARLPFDYSGIVEACSLVELAGIPNSYRLHATAQEYAAVFQNSEQLTVTLAGRIGNPQVSPTPPLWPLLALLLLGWRDTISAERVIERAAELRTEDEVHRGLAIVAYLFPELQAWLAVVPSKIPRWERSLAVPLAARKLVRLETSISTEQAVRPIPWRVTGGSRRGASHGRSGLKNQDAIQYLVSGEGTAVLAVADGHGSDLSFRSDAGSRLAVETAVEVMHRFAETVRAGESRSAIAGCAREILAQDLTQSWRVAVQRHLEARPFTPAEWTNLAALEGWHGQQTVNRHPELAYGSTILAVLATETYVLCMQLGDGDILFVDTQGYTRRAIYKDDQVGKQTASLYGRNAATHFRVQVQLATEDFPALILAATDGYAESFGSEDKFLEIGRDYLSMVGAEGFDGVEERLKDFFGETSLDRSEDDITIGFISRFDRQEEERSLAATASPVTHRLFHATADRTIAAAAKMIK